MAIKKREKIAVGLLFFVAAGFAIVMLVLPKWDELGKNWTQKNQLESQITQMEASIASIQESIKGLEKDIALPEGIVIKVFNPAEQEVAIKNMVNTVVRLATQPGNKLIHLEPYAAQPIQVSLTTEEQKLVDEGKMARPQSPYVTRGYELAIRGTFNTIQEFLSHLNELEELVEIADISLVNEAGPDRTGTSARARIGDAILDPSKPIKLTAKLRLIMERQTGANRR